jgi:predicted RNA-binding Zn-ribbon protein involved in translation (DUF1610 family)
MEKGEDMIIKVKFLKVALSILLFQICGIGYAESEIPYVFEYSLPTSKVNYNHSVVFNHSKHSMDYKITCVDCHHQLEPGAEAVEENCLDCHGSKAIRSNQESRRVSKENTARPYLIVLHDTCVGCHKEIKANNSNSAVPVACWRCHIRKKNTKFN